MAQRQRPPRVMVDATVLIAGSAFPRWPHEVLRHALKGDFTLVLCPLVLSQAQAHLAKDFPNFLKGFETFLINCAHEIVEEPSSEEVEGHPNLIRDKKDIPIALAAIKAKVDYFVSEDKDFTAKDATTKELRKHLRPMLSGTFLREVMDWSSQELEKIRHRQWSDMES